MSDRIDLAWDRAFTLHDQNYLARARGGKGVNVLETIQEEFGLTPEGAGAISDLTKQQFEGTLFETARERVAGIRAKGTP